MARLLFRLNNVSFDEAEAVRALLHEADVAFYETDSGMFGLSIAGIWLSDNTLYPKARQLLDDYAARRALDIQLASDADNSDTLFARALRQPLRFIGVLTLVVLIVYLSVWPFLDI